MVRFRVVLTGLVVAALALAGGPASAGKPVKVDDGFMVDFGPVVLVDPCSPDLLVKIEGKVHVTYAVSFGRGNSVATVRLHLNFAGVHGDALLAALPVPILFEEGRYTGNGTLNFNERVTGPFPKDIGPVPFHFFLLRNGEGGDLKVQGQLRFRVNGNGTVDILDFGIQNLRLECGVFDVKL